MSTALKQRLAAHGGAAVLLKTLLSLDNVRNYVFLYVVGKYALKTYRHLRARGVAGSILEIWRSLSQKVALLALRLPKVKGKVDAEISVAEKSIRDKLVKNGPNVIKHLALPREGRDIEWILDEMERMDVETGGNGGNDAWRNGKVSGAVYHGGKDMEEVILAAFKKYMVTNPLHPDSFPTVRKMEAEIIAMCLRMYNNPNGAGSTTSGGTESIITSCKTHRDWAREVKGITEPEMIMPVSGHTAFDKAGAYLGIKIHHIPVDPVTRQVDVKKVARAINPNTILLVGSAFNFPDGCQDDIVALGALAARYNIGLHVDCCLGSFIVPFLEPAGFPVRPFDFRVKGVTAISCDTHKYGFAPKGSSVIMYRDKELRKYQYFISTTWPGGVYASPTMAGSRPGSLIAATWAAMQYMGFNGYLESCRSVVGTAKHIEATIRRDMKELRILGNPVGSVVSFRSADSTVNIYTVGDLMAARGWHLNGLMNPAGLHLACTRLTVPMAEQFIVDLKECVDDAKGQPAGNGTMIQLYGLAGTSNVGGPLVSRICTAFLDALTLA